MVEERVGNLAWLRKRVEEADTDLLREMVKAMAEALMSVEADSACRAEYGKSSPDRGNQAQWVPHTPVGHTCWYSRSGDP